MLAQGVLSFIVTLMIQYKLFYKFQRLVTSCIFGDEIVKTSLNSDDQAKLQTPSTLNKKENQKDLSKDFENQNSPIVSGPLGNFVWRYEKKLS